MRLQIIAVAAAVIAYSGDAAPAGRAAGWVSFYSSDDGLTIVSPQAALRVPALDRVDIEASYDADVITAASADVVSAASPRGYSEVRHGFSVGVVTRPAEATTLAAHYIPSFEPDYSSQGFSASVEREWIDRRLTTQLGYRLSLDSVGRSGSDRSTFQALSTHNLSAGLAWVFSPKMVGDVAYELTVNDGAQSSPYRFVFVSFPGASLPVGLPESTPETRSRHALAAGLRRALDGGFFGSVRLRLYADSWGVLSYTDEIEVQRAFFDSRLILGLSGRIYGQTGASFHKYRYDATALSAPRYRDADKMLSSSFSILGGARAEGSLGPIGPLADARGTLKIELYEQRFFEYAPLPERRAAIVSIGVAGELPP